MESDGLHKGSMGPVGLPEDAFVIAANSLKAVPKWVVGANEDGYHYVGAQLGKDFKVDQWADIITVKPGDCCPKCGMELKGARGIEVAQVFQLGDKYSRAMNATFMNKDGKEQPFIMGCYGVGVSRTLAAIIEQHNDENGMIWPMSVAPAHVCILPLATGDDLVQPAAEKLAEELAGLGLEVVIDDRKERAGVKFAEADLMGWPLQIVMGKRGLAEGKVEIKRRATGERRDISLEALSEALTFAKGSAVSNNLNAFQAACSPGRPNSAFECVSLTGPAYAGPVSVLGRFSSGGLPRLRLFGEGLRSAGCRARGDRGGSRLGDRLFALIVARSAAPPMCARSAQTPAWRPRRCPQIAWR